MPSNPTFGLMVNTVLWLSHFGCLVNGVRFSFRGEFAWSCVFFDFGFVLLGIIRLIQLLEAQS